MFVEDGRVHDRSGRRGARKVRPILQKVARYEARLESLCTAVSRIPAARCACVTLLLLFLGKASAEAQSDRPLWRTVQVVRASVTSVPVEEEGLDGVLADLARSEFVGVLERHGSVDRYSEVPAAGLRLSHYSAGFKLDLPVVRESRLKLFADFGLGATRVKSSKLGLVTDSSVDISRTYLSFRGGLTAEYAITGDCQIFVSGRELFYFDEDDRFVIEELGNGSKILESGSWTFPLAFGLRLHIN